jgi:hypothetical protein
LRVWRRRGADLKLRDKAAAAAAQGLLKLGCAFHGLHHTIGAFAREGREIGVPDPPPPSATRRRPCRSLRPGLQPPRRANRRSRNVQKRFANIDWKTPLENGKAVSGANLAK